MAEHGYYDDLGVEGFGLVAFPPLITATLSCTAVLEDVGCIYINKYREPGEECINPDETRVGKILDLIEKRYPDSSDFDLDKIDQEVIQRRDEYAHYMERRQQTVTAEETDQFIEGIAEAFWLIRNLSRDYNTRLLE
ncbi:hypothetical protein EFA46_008825 [Halarchaeum sp. CBA1220]|uniref:hypothetical protein n=1 Tax=Halarchaeum sp. CBA1220 TaxID=1853682 RepID=UPI0011CDB2C2|nr:hypothetical protein [Halarchaeum sp. CBA1220]QLC34304.1 hypothetical protein EFA46_008825 [Halarchaeum sp. CBA1220]